MGLQLKSRHQDAAWQTYEEFLQTGGSQSLIPASTWYDLARAAEQQQAFDRAFAEYEKLAAAYPKERQSVMAQIAAARLCVTKLNRPADALRFYQAAAASPVPHLDLEGTIELGIRQAKSAMSAGSASAAAAAAAKA
jgi:tetratricopeptide (TPR) repeat protein